MGWAEASRDRAAPKGWLAATAVFDGRDDAVLRAALVVAGLLADPCGFCVDGSAIANQPSSGIHPGPGTIAPGSVKLLEKRREKAPSQPVWGGLAPLDALYDSHRFSRVEPTGTRFV